MRAARDGTVPGSVIERMAHAHLKHPGPFESCPRHGPRFAWDRPEAPFFLHRGPLVHVLVPALIAGHTCPPNCGKIAEIEGFLDWWQAKTRP